MSFSLDDWIEFDYKKELGDYLSRDYLWQDSYSWTLLLGFLKICGNERHWTRVY